MKRGSIAIPFLSAVFISLIIVGAIGTFIFNKLTGDPVDSGRGRTVSGNYSPTEDDNRTLLLILEPTDNTDLTTFMIMRILPQDKKYVCMPLPNNMITVENASLYETYAVGGVVQLKKQLEASLEIRIDKYMKFNSEGFERICTMLGCVNYELPLELVAAGITYGAGSQQLPPDYIQKVITFPAYKGEEQHRMFQAGEIICAMLNQADQNRLATVIDENFKELANHVETDITAIDYSDMSKALKYLLSGASDPAGMINIYGADEISGVKVNEIFLKDMRRTLKITDAPEMPDVPDAPVIPEQTEEFDANAE